MNWKGREEGPRMEGKGKLRKKGKGMEIGREGYIENGREGGCEWKGRGLKNGRKGGREKNAEKGKGV